MPCGGAPGEERARGRGRRARVRDVAARLEVLRHRVEPRRVAAAARVLEVAVHRVGHDARHLLGALVSSM